MYSVSLYFLITAGIESANPDPCVDLCQHDGESICTRGSFETADLTCDNYFTRSNQSEYCYTIEEKDDCPRENPLPSSVASSLIQSGGLPDTPRPGRNLRSSEFFPVDESSVFLVDSPKFAQRSTRSDENPEPIEVVVGVSFDLDIEEIPEDSGYRGALWNSNGLFGSFGSRWPDTSEDDASSLNNVIGRIVDGADEDEIGEGELWRATVLAMKRTDLDPGMSDWISWDMESLIGFTNSPGFGDHRLRSEILRVLLSVVSYISGLYNPFSRLVVAVSRIKDLCDRHGEALKEAVKDHFARTWEGRTEVVVPRESQALLLFEVTPLYRANSVCPDLFQKDAELKQVVLAQRMQGVVWEDISRPRKRRIEVNRSELLQDSVNRVLESSSTSLRAGLEIRFKNEAGIDEGGLLRDWFSSLAEDIFDPRTNMFQLAQDENNLYRIKPLGLLSPSDEDSNTSLRGVGRIVALAIHHRCPLGVRLPLTVWRQMLGESSVLIDDVKADDPIFYNSLKLVMDTDLDSDEGTGLAHSLIFPDGSSVTEGNKVEYIKASLQNSFLTSIREPLGAFASGFTDIIPLNRFYDLLTPEDLNYMLQGESVFDVGDLYTHSELSGYSQDSPQVVWFWQLLHDTSLFPPERLHLLLKFVTGDASIPLGGFKNLRAPFKINNPLHDNPDERLPTSGTCYFRLDLPEYSTKTILETKLIFAIESNSGFHLAL